MRNYQMHRVKVVFGHLLPSNTFNVSSNECSAAPGAANPDDVVVVHGLRTAIGKAKRGSFKVKFGQVIDMQLYCI